MPHMYKRVRPARLGQNSETVTVTLDELIDMVKKKALEDPTFAAGYALRNKMTARRDILNSLLPELQKQWRNGILPIAEYVDKRDRTEALVDQYNNDIADMNMALANALSETRRETVNALIKEGYDIPATWAGLSGVIAITIAAALILGLITASIKIAVPTLAEATTAKLQKELEREKVASELAREALKHDPDKVQRTMDALEKGRLPKVREWYEYVFWAIAIGASAVAAVKLVPMVAPKGGGEE